MIIIAVSPLDKNRNSIASIVHTIYQQVSGKSVTLNILKRFSSCKNVMRIKKALSSLLLVTKYNTIVSREKTEFVTNIHT